MLLIYSNMKNENPEVSLRVEIKNNNPLELQELTKSLISLSNQYIISLINQHTLQLKVMQNYLLRKLSLVVLFLI